MTESGSVTKLVSKQDASVNFVFNDKQQESRYVRRQDDYINIYLSSHNGCNKACRFCHLTQTGQTAMVESTVDDIVHQAKVALEHYERQVKLKKEPKAQTVNFLFMARGEPLASKTLFDEWGSLTSLLTAIASFDYDIDNVVFKVSTILPTDSPFINNANELTFNGVHQPWLYYSLYSPNQYFRKRWIPKAMGVMKALSVLNKWQSHDRHNRVVIGHWSLIAGENDSFKDLEVLELLLPKDLIIRFNLIAYNPASENQGVASSDEVTERYFNKLKQISYHPDHRIIGRVGFDVKASCGMFYDPAV